MSAGYSVAIFAIPLFSGQFSVPAGECRVKEAEAYDFPEQLRNAEFSNAWSFKYAPLYGVTTWSFASGCHSCLLFERSCLKK